ncbi:MAG: hypothetical protein WD513_04880 [Balneolaceae bacterium]
MAQLETDALAFAAAANSAAITIGRRLFRNFSYYRKRSGQTETVHREELITVLLQIKQYAFGLHNLLNKSVDGQSPFMVTIAGQIHNCLEEIHRKILFYEAEKIENIIPDLDSLRNYWQEYTDEQFYDESLNIYLENSLLNRISNIQKGIQSLPYTAVL